MCIDSHTEGNRRRPTNTRDRKYYLSEYAERQWRIKDYIWQLDTHNFLLYLQWYYYPDATKEEIPQELSVDQWTLGSLL